VIKGGLGGYNSGKRGELEGGKEKGTRVGHGEESKTGDLSDLL